MKREIKIALVVLGGIGIFFFGLNFLKGKNIFGTQKIYWASYPQIDGLTVTNPVWINGFKVGQVSKISFHPDMSGNLLVGIRVTNPDVTLNDASVAKIVSADLLGSKGIDLIVNQGTPLNHNDTIIGDIEDGLADAVSQQLAPIKAKAEDLISSVDSVLIVLRTVLNESSLNELGQSFYGVRSTFESLLVTARNIEELVEKEKANIAITIENVKDATTVFKENGEELDATIKNLKKISDDMADANVKQLASDAQKSIVQVQNILSGIEQGNGSMGKLLKSDTLHNSMVQAVNDMEQLLEDMRSNPARYVNFSLIGRRDKGLILSREEEERLKQLLKMN